MSDEVNVFMDPSSKIYSKNDQTAAAESSESWSRVESTLSKIREKESDKPKQVNCSALSIVKSKLNDAKEWERQKERKNNETVKQAEKEIIKISDEKTVDNSEEAEKEKRLEDVCEVFAVTPVAHKDQKHDNAFNTEEQTELTRNVPLQMTMKCNEDSEEATMFQLERDIIGTDFDCFKIDSLEQFDAIMENVNMTETPVESNPTDDKQPEEEMKAIDDEKIMNIDMNVLSIGEVCLDATKSQDATNDLDQCKAKGNMRLQSDNTAEKKNIKPENSENEHLYEIPDVQLTGSAEYVHKPDERMREQFKQLDNITLHIAVTGSTGAGKSTFINAIRGLQPDHKNAAPTGVIETTMESTMYEHPTMPNVKFWDLPGTGSPKFKAKKYLKEVKLETYDFFIIISSERFKENDIMLAKAITERKKNFYFLRSKIDNDIEAESQRKDFDEEKVLLQIRNDCHGHLGEMNNPNVFLISSFDLNKYDFQALTDTLTKQLPAHKRDALILSLPIYSSKILEEKTFTFMKQAGSAAIASGSIAVAPVPGLSTACDAAILLGFFTKCYYAFGLDDDSIDKLSVRVNNPSLKSVRSSPLVVAIRQKKLSNTELSALTSKEAAVKFAWSMVPGIGSKKAAEMSYNATLNLLRAGLQDLSDTAREVMKAAGVADVY